MPGTDFGHEQRIAGTVEKVGRVPAGVGIKRAVSTPTGGGVVDEPGSVVEAVARSLPGGGALDPEEPGLEIRLGGNSGARAAIGAPTPFDGGAKC